MLPMFPDSLLGSRQCELRARADCSESKLVPPPQRLSLSWFLARLIFAFKKAFSKLGVVVYAYNPSTWELRQEDCGFKASFGYIISSRPASVIYSRTVFQDRQTNKQMHLENI
jgi:hypothetical protein